MGNSIRHYAYEIEKRVKNCVLTENRLLGLLTDVNKVKLHKLSEKNFGILSIAKKYWGGVEYD